MEHIVLTVLVETALVVLIQALEGIFDTSEVRNASIYSLQQIEHWQVSAIECRNMIVVERKLWSSRSNLLAILHQFLDAADMWEWRSHWTDAPNTQLLCVLSQTTALTETAAAYMNDNLKVLWSYGYPSLCQEHSLLGGQHIALAWWTIDKHTLQTVLLKHLGISLDRFQVHITVGIKRSERCINESNDFFHNQKIFYTLIIWFLILYLIPDYLI